MVRGNCLRKVGSDRRSKCSANDVRAIVREVKKNPSVSSPEIQLTTELGNVSQDTFRRVIDDSGEFNSY